MHFFGILRENKVTSSSNLNIKLKVISSLLFSHLFISLRSHVRACGDFYSSPSGQSRFPFISPEKKSKREFYSLKLEYSTTMAMNALNDTCWCTFTSPYTATNDGSIRKVRHGNFFGLIQHEKEKKSIKLLIGLKVKLMHFHVTLKSSLQFSCLVQSARN